MVKWFEDHHVVFPWRRDRDPYKIWLSEVMLQQTTVETVKPYFEAFVQRFPNLESLAKADIHEVLTLWQGLGYYRRAHLLHKGAQFMWKEGQEIPTSLEGLLKVPGIGHYTSRAILSIALGKPHVPVDGNVIRVLSRLFGLLDGYEKLEKNLSPYLLQFEKALEEYSPGFFAQSLMDLGREVCRPKSPKCDLCPIQDHCSAFSHSLQDQIPQKKKKPQQPQKYGRAFIYVKGSQILLIQNGKEGLFPGLWGVPLNIQNDPVEGQSFGYVGEVNHTFTHFKLKVDVYLSYADAGQEGRFFDIRELENFPLSTLMKKVISLYLGESKKKRVAS